jgi:hypothetical protein|tara:strand:+ start:1012 stop:1440 length:429 start_codon:yes stop_codon:yes gene_type:complete
MLVAVATMVCGVLTIALPVSIVGSNFQMEYEKLEREKKKRQQAAEAVEASHKVELISPLQQELSKLSELLDEMDGLAKLAAVRLLARSLARSLALPREPPPGPIASAREVPYHNDTPRRHPRRRPSKARSRGSRTRPSLSRR